MNLTDYSTIQNLRKKHGFFLKKKLGQNFLLDSRVVEETIHGAGVGPEDVVLEIGPGFGTLTRALSGNARHVIAIELDSKLRPIHQETLGDLANVTVVYGDALSMDLDELVQELCPVSASGRIRVVANLPYYITTPILFHLLESGFRLDSITVMVQKEVAQRIQAPPGGKDYGALSVGVQFRSRPEILLRVKAGSFYPSPKVDSAVIHLEILETPAVSVHNETLFFRVVRAAFGQRRKTLLNALGNQFAEFGRPCVAEMLQDAGIDPGRRGETLSLDEFARLADRMDMEKRLKD